MKIYSRVDIFELGNYSAVVNETNKSLVRFFDNFAENNRCLIIDKFNVVECMSIPMSKLCCFKSDFDEGYIRDMQTGFYDG